jgi:hypothetical protein
MTTFLFGYLPILLAWIKIVLSFALLGLRATTPMLKPMRVLCFI